MKFLIANYMENSHFSDAKSVNECLNFDAIGTVGTMIGFIIVGF